MSELGQRPCLNSAAWLHSRCVARIGRNVIPEKRGWPVRTALRRTTIWRLHFGCSVSAAVLLGLVVDQPRDLVQPVLVDGAAQHVTDAGFRPVHRSGVLGGGVAH